MPTVKFFNKGTLRGIVAKSELIEYDKKDGGKDKFLAVEINTDGGTNKVKATFFNTKSNPNKAQELHEQFPVNTKVELSGNIGEREYDSNGKKGIDRSISGMSMRSMKEDAKIGAFFIYQGFVEKIVEVDGGANVTVRFDNTYTPAGSNVEVAKSETVTFFADNKAVDLMDDVDLTVGCNAKFKGRIFNKLEFDDYGDVIDSVSMFAIERVEDVIQKDEIEEVEKPDFL